MMNFSFTLYYNSPLKMFRNVFLSFSLPLLLNFLSSLSAGYWISDLRNARQLQAADDVVKENGTSSSEDLFENSTASLNGDDSLFWTVSDTNETTEGSVMVQINDQDLQNDQEIVSEETNNGEVEALKDTENEEASIQESVLAEAKPTESAEMDQKIVLQRGNCHLEIAIESSHDLKMQIMFGRLQNNTSGKCCITLNGPESSLLAIFITNIHLYENGSDREVLRVITSNHGSAYVLKEYHHQNTYQPLLLTETHKVYLVLYYKVTTLFPNDTASNFNLEVLTYHRNENYGSKQIPKYFSPFDPSRNQNFDKFYTYK